MDPNFFWTVFKADLLFSACSIAFTVLVTLAIARYRKKKMKAAGETKKIEGPRVIVVGGKEARPGHCPLCGHEWPLSGPEEENKL